MYLTPRTKRKDTSTTDYSTNLSRISKKFTTQQSIKSEKPLSPYNKEKQSEKQKQYEKIKPIATLGIKIAKKKVKSPNKCDNQSNIKINHQKYRTNIVSKMSSQQHGHIVSYGVSTFKGFNHIVNPHFLSVNLGSVKNIILAQSFDGTTAAKILRQNFPLQLIDLSLKSQFKNPQNMLYEAYNRIQNKIINKQLENKDNSGSCFLSVIIRNDLIMVANSGCSQAICGTKNGHVLNLSNSHTTKNSQQMKRIIKNGGKLYQTVVNVPYQQQLQIIGPMRLSPCGLIYTRCLGRAHDFRAIQNKNPQSIDQQPSNLTWKPQIKYLKTNQVVWIAIFSQSVLNNCPISFIQQCIKHQMKQKSETYTEHHIAQQISKKITNFVINKGVPDAISVIIVFLTNLKVENQNKVVETAKNSTKTFNFSNNLSSNKNDRKLNSSSSSKKSSLTYLGNRKSFVKQIDENSKNYSLVKMMKNQRFRKENQLKKDFSFNNFF